MHWSMNTLPLPQYVELGVHSLSGILWTVLLLFLWHCYRIGSDLPIPGHTHAGKLKSSSRRSMIPRSGSCFGTKCNARSKLSRSDLFISMETGKDGEHGQAYLAPVLSHALFPAQASAEGKKLYAALQKYAKRYSWVGMGRIHKGLREQVRQNDLSTIQKPHLFFLPDVPSVPFFPRDAHRHDIEVLEANYCAILAEFQAVYQRGMDSKSGWTFVGPKGQAVFPMYNAGICVPGNCRSCPCTYRTLLSLRTFINSNSLGSAGFWLLGPGATLGSSYGPTNTRLRCHLGLQIPPLCELVVGGEPQCWSEGHCLLVDDSFLHTISHKGSSESGPRVILSVDLWHPNVAAAERQALDFMFSPDL
ncbi:aspartate beta-hydroxylase domain-containing protein 2 [Kryptolebias marmoratus]|uniref:aspartate beta-hydroxylase domain-containing protein 2 n=1 Tax=Kryptolebias marmoratus TaxID=37003 RepID=UPI0007F8AC3C|nr:aspartate beta-hydroxylase domain-containing protein 2 [Kryptolebias marmoratus]